MAVFDNIRTCGAYFIYVITLLLLLTKEFLGYPVDWSQQTQSIPERRKNNHEAESHNAKPTILHVSVPRSKDLEANLMTTGLPNNNSVCSASRAIDQPPKQESKRGLSDADDLIIYETGPLKATGLTLPAQPVLPLCPALHQVYEKSQVEPKIGDISTQPLESSVETAPPKLAGPAINALYDALQQHQELGNTTLNRLNFVKGLEYDENDKFRFPAILTVLRHGSTKSQSTIKGVIRARATIDTDTHPSPNPETTNSVLYSSAPSNSPIPKIPQSPSPFSPLPLTSSASASSTSTCSSSDTITEASYTDPRTLTTTSDMITEEIPIHLISLPSWRQDPERAKFVFGSLARGININSGTKQLSDSFFIVEEDLNFTTDSSNETDKPQLDIHFESMIIAMGLAASALSASTVF